MKTIVCIGTFNGIIGGIERYVQNSSELLRRNGFAVHYLHTARGGREQEKFARSFDSISEFSPENDLLKTADLVIVHNIIPVEVLRRLPAERTCFFAHDHNIYCRRHHYYTPVGRTNCRRKHKKFFCFLCSLGRGSNPPLEEYRKYPALVLSDFMAENLRKNGFEKVVKLPAFIRTAKPNRSFVPDGVLRILFLGQLIRGKGADLMLQALAGLDIPFFCTIAGEGKDREMLEKMAADYHLQDKVRFAGFVSEPERLWENSDIFFFPIRWQEPFGLVGLESLAHGVPVLAFDLGGVREYLSGSCGVLVPERNTALAARHLKELYQQPELLEKMGANGLKIAADQFSEENFVLAFKRLCEVLE